MRLERRGDPSREGALAEADTVETRESQWLVDLTSDCPTVREGATTPGHPRPRRRVVAVLAALLATSGLTVGAAWVNYERGLQWQTRAVMLERQLGQTASRVNVAEQDAIDAQSALAGTRREAQSLQRQLELSESDVAELESRLAVLADAKAQVEDKLVLDSRSPAAVPTTQVTAVQDQLDGCLTQLSLWMDRAPGADSDEVTLNRWLGEGDAVRSSCDEAATKYEVLAGSQR